MTIHMGKLTPASGLLLMAVALLTGAQAQAAPPVVQSFEFTYARGRVDRVNDISTTVPSAQTFDRLQASYPDIREVQLFCTPLSGPRFAYIDGLFYKLNQKARRDDARLITSDGPVELLDIDEPPSPLAGDFLMILNLTRDAGEACWREGRWSPLREPGRLHVRVEPDLKRRPLVAPAKPLQEIIHLRPRRRRQCQSRLALRV